MRAITIMPFLLMIVMAYFREQLNVVKAEVKHERIRPFRAGRKKGLLALISFEAQTSSFLFIASLAEASRSETTLYYVER